MKPETIVIKKIIKDNKLSNKLKAESIKLNAGILKATKGGAQKWKLTIEEQQKKKEKSEIDVQK